MGREVWNKPTAEVLALGELMGFNLAKPAAVITPNQAVKLGLDEKIVKTYAIRPKGEMKLAQDDGSLARKIFGGNK